MVVIFVSFFTYWLLVLFILDFVVLTAELKGI